MNIWVIGTILKDFEFMFVMSLLLFKTTPDYEITLKTVIIYLPL